MGQVEDGAGLWPELLPLSESYPVAGCPHPFAGERFLPFPRGSTRPLRGGPAGPANQRGPSPCDSPSPISLGRPSPSSSQRLTSTGSRPRWTPGIASPSPWRAPGPDAGAQPLEGNDSSILGCSTSHG